MTDTTSGQVTVNFVRYHPDIIGQANFNNPLKFISKRQRSTVLTLIYW